MVKYSLPYLLMSKVLLTMFPEYSYSSFFSLWVFHLQNSHGQIASSKTDSLVLHLMAEDTLYNQSILEFLKDLPFPQSSFSST